MKKKVKIIIVTFQASKWIRTCLQSVILHHNLEDTIIVDNASTDGTTEIIKKEFFDAHLIELKENLGFGRANNIGIQEALQQDADFAFLLNQDAYLTDNCLQQIIEVSNQYPEYGILSPFHLSGSGQALDYNFQKYLAGGVEPSYFDHLIINGELKLVYDIPFVNAAAWLITRACLELVGGFNPSFFHYGEDNNYCKRVLYHGLKIGVVPKTFVIHDREQNPGSNTFFKNVDVVEKRKMIAKYSDPSVPFTYPKLGLQFLKKIVVAIVTIDIQQIRNATRWYSNMKELDLKQIFQNRDISKQRGRSFIS